MPLWYRVNGFGSSRIHKVEATRSTAKSVWLKTDRGERRFARRSDLSWFFETFDEARDFVLKRLRHRHDNAVREAARSESRIATVGQLTDDDLSVDPNPY